MKKLLLVILLLNSIIVNAQFGEKGGPSFSNTIFDTYTNDEITVQANRSLYFGFQVGAFRRFDLNNMYLQLEVIFNINRSGFVFTEKANNNSINYIQSFVRADVPIYLGYKLESFRFFAGPVFNGYLFSLTARENSEYAEFFDILGFFSTSFSVGVGCDFGQVGIDLCYQSSITKFEQDLISVYTSHDNILLKSHSNLIVLSFIFYNL